MRIYVGDKVIVKQASITTPVRDALGSFRGWNEGEVLQIVGLSRFGVHWHDDAIDHLFWFDADQLEKE